MSEVAERVKAIIVHKLSVEEPFDSTTKVHTYIFISI